MTIDETLLGFFAREAAPDPEPFTGERMTGAVAGQIAIEHYHRYLFARSLCLGKDVLDVASGEGYGSALLAQVARRVVGVEYAAPTVSRAGRNFPRPNLHFVNGDARGLPLADASLDVVVSFETIEHFAGQEAFVAEVRRVLRPDGCFIVSTPDRDNYTPTGAPTNAHHVRELSRREFTELLSRHFRHCRTLFQRPLVGSAVLAEDAAASDPLVFERRGENRLEACIGLPRPLYVIAVAADDPIPPLPHSVYIERSDIDTGLDTLRAQREEIERLRQTVHAGQAELAAREERLRAAETEAAAREETLRRALADTEAERVRWETKARDAEQVAGSIRRFLLSYPGRLRRHLSGG